MDNFVTIKTFTYGYESAIIRARLESEGIECYLKDELTAQVQPFYSNAIGGVKLQVKEGDVAQAIEILKESGDLEDEHAPSSNLFAMLDHATAKIPFVNRYRFEPRVVILIAFFLLSVLCVGYYATRPSTFEKLANTNWCVENIIYNGKDYHPNSIEYLQITGASFCKENIDFRQNDIVLMPGFNSHGASGSWKMQNNFLLIADADTFGFVYNGHYDIDFISNGLILKSQKTEIYCHAQNLNIGY